MMLTNMRLRDSHHPYAMITILCWSLIFVLTRLMMPTVSSASIGALRCVIASLVMATSLVLTRSKLPKWKDIPYFVLAGILGFYLYLLMFNEGLRTVNSSTSSVVIATTPVITAAMASRFHKERLKLHQWLSIGLSLVGVMVLAFMKDSFTARSGIYWLLVSAFFLSFYNILQRSLARRYTALETATYSMFGGTVFFLFHLPKAFGELQGVRAEYFLYLLILGIFSSAIAYVMWAKALSKARLASQVTNYMFVTPFLSTFWGFALAGETVGTSTIIGGAIILFGLFLFNWGESVGKAWVAKQKGAILSK